MTNFVWQPRPRQRKHDPVVEHLCGPPLPLGAREAGKDARNTPQQKRDVGREKTKGARFFAHTRLARPALCKAWAAPPLPQRPPPPLPGRRLPIVFGDPLISISRRQTTKPGRTRVTGRGAAWPPQPAAVLRGSWETIEPLPPAKKRKGRKHALFAERVDGFAAGACVPHRRTSLSVSLLAQRSGGGQGRRCLAVVDDRAPPPSGNRASSLAPRANTASERATRSCVDERVPSRWPCPHLASDSERAGPIRVLLLLLCVGKGARDTNFIP